MSHWGFLNLRVILSLSPIAVIRSRRFLFKVLPRKVGGSE